MIKDELGFEEGSAAHILFEKAEATCNKNLIKFLRRKTNHIRCCLKELNSLSPDVRRYMIEVLMRDQLTRDRPLVQKYNLESYYCNMITTLFRNKGT